MEENLFDQPVRNDLRTYDNIKKNYNYYKIIAIDLSKLQVLDADPKAIQQINFTGNLD